METTMRIWDIMLVEQHCGVLIRIALAIFYIYHDMILQCSTSSNLLMLFMTCTQTLLDCDEIIRIAHEDLCYVSKAQVEKRRKQFRKDIEKEYLKSVKFIHSN